jgi:hypothetical protein
MMTQTGVDFKESSPLDIKTILQKNIKFKASNVNLEILTASTKNGSHSSGYLTVL